MNRISKTLIVGLLFGLSGVFLTANTLARTPDSETPAQETVCDPLKAEGVTKGLYGLCVAFCEAQDLPTDLSDPEALANLEPSSIKILENYDKKRGENDPRMPCVVYESTCPLWTLEELQMIGNHPLNNTFLWNDLIIDDGERWGIIDFQYGYDAIGTYIAVTAGVLDTYAYDSKQGSYGYITQNNDLSDDISRVMYLDDEAFAICEQQIRDHVVPGAQNP